MAWFSADHRFDMTGGEGGGEVLPGRALFHSDEFIDLSRHGNDVRIASPIPSSSSRTPGSA